MVRLSAILDGASTVALLIVAACVVDLAVAPRLTGGGRIRPLAIPKQPLSLEGARTRGSATAKVGIIEFADFQCPFCGSFARNTLPELDALYVNAGRVLFAFKQFPLAEIHPLALRAAQGAFCADRQGRFWDMHDALFSNPGRLHGETFDAIARTVGLDTQAFDRCLEGPTDDSIEADIKVARGLNISSTPAFFIGTIEAASGLRVTTTIRGAVDVSDFRRALDSLLMPRQ